MSEVLMLLVAIWIAELLGIVILLAWWLVLDARRDPPEWWLRRQVPDFVPRGWGGIDVIDPTPPKGAGFQPHLDDPGGDAEQTTPARRPR